MGPYGSVGAHIKSGRSPMAQDHFKTPPGPQKGHGMTKKTQTQEKHLLDLAKLIFHLSHETGCRKEVDVVCWYPALARMYV